MGIRITVVEEKRNPGFYSAHIWKDGSFYMSCPIVTESREKTRQAAKEWLKEITKDAQ